MTTTGARAAARRATGAGAAVVALGLLLGACATTTEVEPLAAGAPTGTSGTPGTPGAATAEEDPLAWADLSRVSADQLAEVEDREVTAEEYAAAFERYRACSAEAGHPLGSVLHHDLVYRYVVSDAAVQDGTDGACYETELQHVDGLW